MCELKYAQAQLTTANATDSPLDALLQLLSYYAMVVQNAAALDVHHENARNTTFKWHCVSNDVKLILKAPQEYWEFWQDDSHSKTPKAMAFRQIVEQCGNAGLCIETECCCVLKKKKLTNIIKRTIALVCMTFAIVGSTFAQNFLESIARTIDLPKITPDEFVQLYNQAFKPEKQRMTQRLQK